MPIGTYDQRQVAKRNQITPSFYRAWIGTHLLKYQKVPEGKSFIASFAGRTERRCRIRGTSNHRQTAPKHRHFFGRVMKGGRRIPLAESLGAMTVIRGHKKERISLPNSAFVLSRPGAVGTKTIPSSCKAI